MGVYMNNNENNNFGLGDFENANNQNLTNNQNINNGGASFNTEPIFQSTPSNLDINNTMSNNIPDNNGINSFSNGIASPSNENQVNQNQFGSAGLQPQVSNMNQVNGIGQQPFTNNQEQINNMSMNGGAVSSLNTMDSMNQQAGTNMVGQTPLMDNGMQPNMMGQSTMMNQSLENPVNQGIQSNMAADMNQANPMNSMPNQPMINNNFNANPMQASQNSIPNNMPNMGNGGMLINNESVPSLNQVPSTSNNKLQAILKNNGKYIIIGVVIVILIFLAISFAKNAVGSNDSSLKKNEKLLATCSKDSSESGLSYSLVYKVILNKDYVDRYGLKLLQELHFYTQSDITDEQLEQVKEAYTSDMLETPIACPDGNQTADVGCDTKVYKVNNREFVVSGYTYKMAYHLDQKDNMIQEIKDAGYTCK